MERSSADPHEATSFWPFVISRGRTVTYKVVVAPDFLGDARLTGILWDLAGGEPTEPGHARWRVVTGAPTGDFVLMFRVLLASPVTESTPGAPGHDEHGRRIPVITGMIERGATFVPETRAGVLETAHRRCLPALRAFWADDRAVEPERAQAFRAARHDGETLRWEQLPPFRMPRTDAPGGGGRRPREESGGTGERDAEEEAPDPVPVRPRLVHKWRIAAGLAVGAAVGWAAVTRRGGG
ncbi:hypothetical protein [Streptomyces sp. NPDC002564]|uniref:hypothetical protein n=1 Tax=Streptomyces sp. NPDC002564 TaxID=3364649 RepID=UPI00368F7DD2